MHGAPMLLCKQCGIKEAKILFCSRQCAATFNNLKRGDKNRKNCLWCNNKTLNKMFCSYECTNSSKKFRNNEKFLQALKEGFVIDEDKMKELIILTKGRKCQVCNLDTWNGKPIPLELDHIDGNSENRIPENYRIICPNCHAQTPTFKGKNRGNGRYKRAERYRQNKSF